MLKQLFLAAVLLSTTTCCAAEDLSKQASKTFKSLTEAEKVQIFNAANTRLGGRLRFEESSVVNFFVNNAANQGDRVFTEEQMVSGLVDMIERLELEERSFNQLIPANSGTTTNPNPAPPPPIVKVIRTQGDATDPKATQTGATTQTANPNPAVPPPIVKVVRTQGDAADPNNPQQGVVTSQPNGVPGNPPAGQPFVTKQNSSQNSSQSQNSSRKTGSSNRAGDEDEDNSDDGNGMKKQSSRKTRGLKEQFLQKFDERRENRRRGGGNND